MLYINLALWFKLNILSYITTNSLISWQTSFLFLLIVQFHREDSLYMIEIYRHTMVVHEEIIWFFEIKVYNNLYVSYTKLAYIYLFDFLIDNISYSQQYWKSNLYYCDMVARAQYSPKSIKSPIQRLNLVINFNI